MRGCVQVDRGLQIPSDERHKLLQEGGTYGIVWSGVVAFISYKLVDMVIGLRVSEEEEREGLDISSHGETAYEM